MDPISSSPIFQTESKHTNDKSCQRRSQSDSEISHNCALLVPSSASNGSTVSNLAETSSDDEGGSGDTNAGHRGNPDEEVTPGRSPIDSVVAPGETVDKLQETSDCSPDDVENTSDIPCYELLMRKPPVK